MKMCRSTKYGDNLSLNFSRNALSPMVIHTMYRYM